MEKLPNWNDVARPFFDEAPLGEKSVEFLFNALGADIRNGVRELPLTVSTIPEKASNSRVAKYLFQTSGDLYISPFNIGYLGMNSQGIRLKRYGGYSPLQFGEFKSLFGESYISNLDLDFTQTDPDEMTTMQNMQAISQLYLFCFWMAKYEFQVSNAKDNIHTMRCALINNRSIATDLKRKVNPEDSQQMRDFWLAKAQLLRNIFAMYRQVYQISTSQF